MSLSDSKFGYSSEWQQRGKPGDSPITQYLGTVDEQYTERISGNMPPTTMIGIPDPPTSIRVRMGDGVSEDSVEAVAEGIGEIPSRLDPMGGTL